MPRCLCIIQQGQAADRQRDALAHGLSEIGQQAFGDAPASLDISWTAIAPDFGFTAGKPSTSSLVMHSVPPGLPLREREAFMREVCALWERVTGCSRNEIVVVAWDGTLPL